MDLEEAAQALVKARLQKAGKTVLDDVRNQMASDLLDRLQDVVNNAILDAVPEHLHGEFSRAIDSAMISPF